MSKSHKPLMMTDEVDTAAVGSPVEYAALKQRYFTPAEANIAKNSRTYSVHHRPVLLSSQRVQDSQQYASYKSMAESAQAPLKIKTLDGFALLDATGAGVPDDARQAVLSNKNFHNVAEQDLIYFTGLQFLDLSENHLNVQDFANLWSLKELRLPCNAITQIKPLNMPGGFQKLLSLDLSYNKVDLQSIRSLYYLPVLRDLDLSGNEITSLPPDLYHLKCLEKIILERNKLDDIQTFPILSSLPQIRAVSVAFNFLSEVPIECSGEGKFK
jgi:Leucine-rich repeat (LRR) protein